ncbi:MAG: class I SAM-dependent methyltransferase [Thermodesulfobacteriota bacterium]
MVLAERDPILQKTTSCHHINADSQLSPAQKGLYFVVNAINNLFPMRNVDQRIVVQSFLPETGYTNHKHMNPLSSPSRYLSDLFWAQRDWQSIQDMLGGEIRVLDIGCGSGRYYPKLMAFSGGRIVSYHGIDIHPFAEWSRHQWGNGVVDFSVYDGRGLELPLSRRPNLIISQSAFEHIEEDMTVFRQLADYCRSSGFSVMQIHLVPSSACLKLYMLHGIRQYTPRTISKVTRLFGNHHVFTLYMLGGKRCNDLHWNYITKPLLMKKKDGRDNRLYPRLLHEAVFVSTKATSSPSFYALIIQ